MSDIFDNELDNTPQSPTSEKKSKGKGNSQVNDENQPQATTGHQNGNPFAGEILDNKGNPLNLKDEGFDTPKATPTIKTGKYRALKHFCYSTGVGATIVNVGDLTDLNGIEQGLEQTLINAGYIEKV